MPPPLSPSKKTLETHLYPQVKLTFYPYTADRATISSLGERASLMGYRHVSGLSSAACPPPQRRTVTAAATLQ